jgi:hypothetical protein
VNLAGNLSGKLVAQEGAELVAEFAICGCVIQIHELTILRKIKGLHSGT